MTLGEAANVESEPTATSATGASPDVSILRGHNIEQSTLPRTMTWTTSRDLSNTAALEAHQSSVGSQAPGFDGYLNNTQETEAAWPERGRSLLRKAGYHNPLARAESRARNSDAFIEINPVSIGKRVLSRSSTFHDDPEEAAAILDDNLLEPCPIPSLCTSVSEVINGSWLHSTEPSESEFPIRKPQSLASMLPAETLQQIYYHMSPADFDCARHSCRSWFINSLERSLLMTMCKRAGIFGNISNKSFAHHTGLTGKATISDEWFMSKRLTRENALSPNWRGNGLVSSASAFVNIASINFTKTCTKTNIKDDHNSLITISTCGSFLMAANGCLLRVFELDRKPTAGGERHKCEPGYLRLITCIICPTNVLASSMDTSSGRYAIAILLEGRIGMVCDVTSLKEDNHQKRQISAMQNSDQQNHQTAVSPLHRVFFNNSTSPTCAPAQQFVFPGIAASRCTDSIGSQDSQTDLGHPSNPSSRQGSVSRLSVLSQSRHDKRPINQLSGNIDSLCSMQVENGARSIFHNIGSADDPPRSVAICPQRRCVAFGCSSGIELHWVDAHTGQDLNRWFPLTSPSDFLFFLPPRKRVDSAKKLRLISSAARPCDKVALDEGSLNGSSQRSPFWQRLGWNLDYDKGDRSHSFPTNHSSGSTQNVIGRRYRGSNDCTDHFRAIPLSDGYHILFTDPATGLLCLGSDAPLGGPTKLLRKFWFEGPDDGESPTMYAGGSDMTHGVRIVAAYGTGLRQKIRVFSIPLDIFTYNYDASITSERIGSSAIRNKNMEWSSWLNDELKEVVSHFEPLLYQSSRQVAIPVRIRGQEIGECSDIAGLAIDSGPNVTIWAFGKNSCATVWKLDSGDVDAPKTRFILPDGSVRETDCDGDIKMLDNVQGLDICHQLPQVDIQTFDGSCSDEPSPSSQERPKRPTLPHSPWSSQEGRYSFEHLSWTILESGTVNQTPHWTPGGYKRAETDFIARLDIEIH